MKDQQISVGDKVSYILNGHQYTGYVLRPVRHNPSLLEVSDTNSVSGQVYVLNASDLTKIDDYEARFK